MRVVVATVVCALLALPSAAAAEAQTISASMVFDLIAGHSVPKYTTADTKGASKVTCLSASAEPTSTSYAACYIFGPGVHQNVPAGYSVVTTGPGVVRLGCDGYPYPVTCSARIEAQP